MQHIRTLKLVNLFASGFFGLVALPCLVFVVCGVAILPGQPKEGLMFFVVGLALFVSLTTLAFAHLYVAFMITAGRARHLQTMLATLQVANLPVGTVYSAYALWVCYVHESSSRIFANPLGRRVS